MDANGRIRALEEELQREQKINRALMEQLQGSQKTAKDVRAAQEAKGQFLANMSHEIRTPLNGVMGMLDLLRSSELTAEQAEFAATASQSASHLLHLLSDILEFSKLESGSTKVDSAPFHLRQVADDALEMFARDAAHKGIRLDVEMGHGVPDQILGDSMRVTQVLCNLVGNAVKFTDEGSVRIEFHWRKGEKAPLVCRVSDTGIGIPPDSLHELFEWFHQADNTPSRKAGGAGIGLAIAYQMIELMGGELGVDSELGEGSTFWFTIDCTACPSPAAAPARIEPQPDDVPAGSRVLVVEDNHVNQTVARRVLEKAGARVEVAANGEEGVSIVARDPLDLVLMDCQMPIMDGFDATRAIRKLGPKYLHLPIVALTANATPEDREACLEAGMDDFVTKPVRRSALLAAIRRWIPSAAGGP